MLWKMKKNQDEIKRLCYDVAKERQDPSAAFLHDMRQNGSWGGVTTALFVRCVFWIDICIVTNSTRGFIVNDLRLLHDSLQEIGCQQPFCLHVSA